MNYRLDFFKYLIDNNLLNTNYLQIDLIPGRDESLPRLPDLEECIGFPQLECLIYSGYNYEIRENRYYVILVDEFAKIKQDIEKYKKI
jgi:hypothetical protein